MFCMRTRTFRREWLKQRQSRITGCRAYELFTYAKNKNLDWEKKTQSHFFPKPFTNKFVKYGIACEPLASAAYEEEQNVKVIPYGLVVSKQNKWLGYTPNRVVFKDGKPWKLIEIKCPSIAKLCLLLT